MNREALRQLTEIGINVAPEAAQRLEENDIERIQRLDTDPMYLSGPMLDRLREAVDLPSEVEVESNDQVVVQSQNGEQDSAEEPQAGAETNQNTGGGIELEDSGRKNSLETKVEILDSHEITKKEKDVPEFLEYYNDRYDRTKEMLTRRKELQSATTLNRLSRREEGEQAAAIGLVSDKYSTNSGRYIVELQDKTGSFKALVDEDEGDRLVPDEVIGVTGSMGDDILFANQVVHPDLPIPDGVNTTQQEVKAAYISDLHIGSQDTMHDALDRFGDWLRSDEASNIGYLVIAGDIVEGVGVYPGQEEELEITDVYRQYRRFEEWAEKLPDRIQLVIGPGNHDVVRLAEPQPTLPDKAFDNIHTWDNVHLVQNPQTVRLHGIRSQGIKHLMYHGMSYDDHVSRIKELRENAYDQPEYVMEDLLKRRHVAPSYGSNPLSPEGTDAMVIEHEPDVFVSGHFHSHCNESYKGVNMICSSSFQAQTDFQKRVGHQPQPGIVTIMDFETRKTTTKEFKQ